LIGSEGRAVNRIVLGALGALLLVAAGLFWWQGRATNAGPPPAPRLALDTPTAEADELPDADREGLQGPALPQATEQTREQKRFDRLDRDRDGRITRNEMLAPASAISASSTWTATTCSASRNGRSRPPTASRPPTPTATVPHPHGIRRRSRR
jgi:heme A synthase